MTRRAFFSFHYEEDIWRVSQVRNSWVTKDRDTAGFWDAAAWETVKRGGESSITRWIDKQLSGTSVTVVLIGSKTFSRKYVRYEIQRSHELGKGLVGVRIHSLRGRDGLTSVAGVNPFDCMASGDVYGRQRPLSNLYRTYDWVNDDGYSNLAGWIEAAAVDAGR